MEKMTGSNEWDIEIRTKTSWLELDLKSVWEYRDLLILLVRRDYVASFKQTLLGPLWFFIQPILTTFMFVVVFGHIAKIGTDGMPKAVFYMSGVIMWNYFASCLNNTATTFTANASIFGKVYFPRLIMPLSVVISNLFKFGLQFLLFLGILIYYIIKGESQISISYYVLLTPLLLLVMAALGLSLGLIISSLTTKYRDLVNLIAFGVQLLMYATPVVYSSKNISGTLKQIIDLNPMSGVIEGFRFAFTGAGVLDWGLLMYSAIVSIVLLFIALIVFNRVEKSFMDTV
jgi:lipopolysaccharide transport system permease protein